MIRKPLNNSAIRLSGLLLLAGALGACGSTPELQTASTATIKPSPAVATSTATTYTGPPPPAYQLTAAEQALTCSQLTGSIKIRLLELRAADPDSHGSTLARSIQSAVTPLFGGTSHGVANAEQQVLHDWGQVHAYNRQLAAKNCPTVELPPDLQTLRAATPPGYQNL